MRLPGDQRFAQSINDASVAKDFYAVEGHEDGDDVIEKSLSEVGAGGKLGLRQRLERQGGEVTDELVETLWQQATHHEGPPIQRPKAEHIKQMIELAGELHKYIVGRPWSLVQFDRRSLITSDAPVGLVQDPRDEAGWGGGYMTAWDITFPLTRKLGLLMSSPDPLIDLEIPVEEVHKGAADTTQLSTAKLGSCFNYHTVVNASEWLFHHPEDEKFVPEHLPEPNRVSVAISGMDHDFDGEPWFTAPRDAYHPRCHGRHPFETYGRYS